MRSIRFDQIAQTNQNPVGRRPIAPPPQPGAADKPVAAAGPTVPTVVVPSATK